VVFSTARVVPLCSSCVHRVSPVRLPVSAPLLSMSSNGPSRYRLDANECSGDWIEVECWTDVYSEDPRLSDFKCSIADVIMKEPVKAADGYYYERAKIEERFRMFESAGKTILSPMTQKPMGKQLVPAVELTAAIQAFKHEFDESHRRARMDQPALTRDDVLVEWEEHGLQIERRCFRTGNKALFSSGHRQFSNMSKKMSEVFKELDPIRSLLQSVLKDLTPPKITVIGDASAGKSTILEQLAMMPIFPRNECFCTRLAIHVRLRRNPLKAEAIISVRSKTGDQETIQGVSEIIPIAQGHVHVQELMEKLISQEPDGGGAVGVLKSKIIVLEVHHPDVPSIDLVDLPGLTNEESRDAEVRQIINMQIQEDKATGNHNLYLAIVPASARPNTNTAVSFLKENMLQTRAFGVFSHCDEAGKNKPDILRSLMTGVPTDKGTLAENIGYVPLEKGWVATMLAPPEDDGYPAGYYDSHNSERLYMQKQEEIRFFSGEGAHPHLRELFDKGKAGVPALVDQLVDEYHKYLSCTWMPGAMKKVLHMLEEKNFERNLLGASAPTDKELKAAEEVERRLHPSSHLSALYERYLREEVQGELVPKILQQLDFAFKVSLPSHTFGEKMGHTYSTILNTVRVFLARMEIFWLKELELLLTAETKPKEESGSWSLQTIAEGLLVCVLPPQKKREMYQAVKDHPPFQLSQYKEYTDAIITKCQAVYRAAVVDLDESAARLCEHLVDPTSKWMSFSIDAELMCVNVTCDVRGFVDALTSQCFSKIPPPSSLRHVHSDIPVGAEAVSAINHRTALDAEIHKIEAARDGIRRVMKKSGCEMSDTVIATLEAQAIDEADQRSAAPISAAAPTEASPSSPTSSPTEASDSDFCRSKFFGGSF